MQSITVYRLGDGYTLDPEAEGAEPVTLICEGGVEARRSQLGPARLYRFGAGYGMSVEDAIQQGWCRVE